MHARRQSSRARLRVGAVTTAFASIALAGPLAAGFVLSSGSTTPYVAPGSVGVLTPGSLTPINASSGGVIALNGTQTIRNAYVRGHIYWNAQGGTLTIENSIIEGGYGSWGMISGEGSGRLVITDSTVRWRAGTPPPSGGVIGSGAVHSYGWETDITRSAISGMGDGVKIGTSGSSIVNSWIHDLVVIPGTTHNDCVQIAAGTNIEIRGSRMDCPNVNGSGNAAIFLQGTGIGTVTIEDNYLAGGAYVLYAQHGQVHANRNTFGPFLFGPWWGTFASFSGNVMAGQTPTPTTTPATAPPTTAPPTTAAPTTLPPTTAAPTTVPPTTRPPTTLPPTTLPPTTLPPITAAPTTLPPTTAAPTTVPPTTRPPTTLPPITAAPTTMPPITAAPTVPPATAPSTVPASTVPPTTVAPQTTTTNPPRVRPAKPRRTTLSRSQLRALERAQRLTLRMTVVQRVR